MGFQKKVYFDNVRVLLFNGSMSQQQVDGQNFILREWHKRFGYEGDHRQLAYMLATTFHETGRTMYPVKEYGSQSYLTSKPYYPYMGRGFVQLTWLENYEKGSVVTDEDLVEWPDTAMVPDIAAIIMFDGMFVGWFTGKCLDDYFTDEKNDPVNARQIINGNDCDDQIAEYHYNFLTAIDAATA